MLVLLTVIFTWLGRALDWKKQTKRNPSFPPSYELKLSSCYDFDVISLYVNDCPHARKNYS